VGCIALATDGRVIAAMETRIAALRLHDAGEVELQDLARIDHPAPGMRFNDGRCDPAGRLWVGTMVMDMPSNQPRGGLYRLDEQGLSGPHVTGLYTPNGSAFSPDGRTLYLSDSHPHSQQVWAFDFDPGCGQLGVRRPFIDMQDWPGRPDGAAVDEQGHYWICGNDAGLVHCFAPDGAWLRSVQVPFPKPSMCCFGGPRLDTLFVTSIVPAQPSPNVADLSGAVIALQPGVRGRAEPRFSRYP
jgi:sugar lactone lactonase YvrE